MQKQIKNCPNTQLNQDKFSNKLFQNSDSVKKLIKNGKFKTINQQQSPLQFCKEQRCLPLIQKAHVNWKNSQVRDLFKYYDQFGSRWSQIQIYFPEKTQNNIKNKFYGFLKMLLRHLFKQIQSSSGLYMKNLSANEILQIYEGTKKYRKFKSLLKNYINSSRFEISRKKIKCFIQSNQQKIKALYESIRGANKFKNEYDQVNQNVNVSSRSDEINQENSIKYKVNFQQEQTITYEKFPQNYSSNYVYNPNAMLFYNQSLMNCPQWNNFYLNSLMFHMHQ